MNKNPTLKELEEMFYSSCSFEAERMMKEKLPASECQDIYSKYQAVFLMLDMATKVQRSLSGEDKEMIQKILTANKKQ